MAQRKDLVVFDRLRVHQLRVEAKRVRALYTVERNDSTSETAELIYSYNQPFFDPRAATDVNLASMMVAQVALNYGLFCRELIFDGLFEAADQRFLLDMLENTSREIYVNKFLSPNEFLKPPFDQMQPEPGGRFTAAEVIFTNAAYPNLALHQPTSVPDYGQFAVLSSGGKDSLLTYGMMREIGDVHPVFVNESGRHWYTAYNAYRYFAENEPNTVKPWCNSDRIFNWMVRQMPFIRENFQNIRADIYPIRLWTVAVFLFGVLPVVRKRDIGNVLIGNEYDTTLKLNRAGITHYAALYDQSKYFDNALTRYYQRKGWHLRQFSVLRSLSELLILKALVKRYPDLQRTQVSCHAAHKEGEVMRPCGNCEKCRRIVGMLRVLDEDPRRCGYTEEQIGRCLRALETKKVKQIGTDASHLYHLLLSKELIANTEHTRRLAKEHPQIMQLRFDNERSMLRDLPVNLRKPILELLAKYANGSVRLQGRHWKPVTWTETEWQQPYFINQPES